MKKMLCWMALLGLVLPAGAWAQAPSGSGSGGRSGAGSRGGTQDGRKGRQQANAAQRVLAKKVEQIDWEDVSLDEVVEWAREQGDANILVQWRALEAEGIDAASPVTLRLKNTTVGKVLAEVLEQVSEGDTVMYRGMGNTIKISTRWDFNRKLYVRVYDVSDLLLRIPDFTDAPTIDLTQTSGGGGGRGGGGGDSIFGGGGRGGGGGGRGGGDDDDAAAQERLLQLIDLIQATVEPETWELNGGRGTIMAYGKLLVVRNSIEVHEKIGGPFVFE